MSCPICKGKNSQSYMESFDDRYGYPGTFDLDKCLDCGHIYLTKEFSDDELENLYTKYYPRAKLSVDDHKPHKTGGSFTTWLNGDRRSAYRWVPEKVRILDIGCGFGESLAYHKSRDCDVYGVEADSNIQKVVDKFGYTIHIGLFNHEIYESNFFDYVTLDQVMEHVVDPINTLKGIEKILKPGGIIVLSVPNPRGWGRYCFGRRWINWHAPYHLHHYTLESMAYASREAGLIGIKTKTITSSNWLYFQWQHLATFPRAGDPSDFWTGKRFIKLSYSTQMLYLLAWLANKLKINHIVTRIFDTLTIGDNRLFVLQKPIETKRQND
jgi:2-polyprenyl-3-methyl-5-hydroxy-6-metoxy-1,4-benzoquinol methylase